MSKPERILTRHYKNGIINARADDDPWHYPPSSGLIPDGEGEYIRSDLGSFYQEKDIDSLMAERDNLRGALESIATIAPMWEGGMGYSKANLQGTLDEVRQIARAALTDTQEDRDDD